MPGATTDNDTGIDCMYETMSTQDLMRVNQLGGLSVNATGYGDLYVSVVYGRRSATAPDGHIDLKPLRLADTQDKAPPAVGARGQNEHRRQITAEGAKDAKSQPNLSTETRRHGEKTNKPRMTRMKRISAKKSRMQ